MITKEQEMDLLGIFATASIIVVGFAMGVSLGPTVIGPSIVGAIGVNLGSTLIQNGGIALKERWLSSENGIFNQDIQRTLARAFMKALKYVETAYFERGQANALPKNEQASIRALFRELRDQAQEIFLKSYEEIVAEQHAHRQRIQDFFSRRSAQPQDASPTLSQRLTAQQELERYLYGTPEEAKEMLWLRIDEEGFLSTYNEDFRDFFRKNLLNTIKLCFAEELNTDSKESNRAWRAFQRLLLEGIQADIQSIQASQSEIQETLKKLDTLQSQLQQLHDDFRSSDEPFQIELEQVLREIRAEMQDIAQSILRTEQKMAEAATQVNKLVALAEGHFIKEGGVVEYHLRRHDDNLVDKDLLNESRGGIRFVGRKHAMENLTNFMLLGGYMLVTAPAGGGKSTLMAYWLRSFAHQTAICYHFFDTKWRTDDFTGFMTCLSEQLLYVHDIKGQVRESEPTKLYTIINEILSIPHPSGLVVIVDGLDEARDLRYPDEFALPRGLFPNKLGEGITVIFTIRTTDGAVTAKQLRSRLDLPLEHFPLPELDAAAVQDLLRQSGNEPLEAKANDLDFAERLREKTGGLAIYLRFLVEELARSTEQDWDRTINRLPMGFKEFVKEMTQEVNTYPAWRDALRYLALAKGQMSDSDLLSLTDLSHNPLQPEDFDAVPWSVQRWLSRQEGVWAFQHTSIAEAYAEAYMRNKLDKQFLQHLFDYCAAWRQHKSLYTLQYYALHLWEEKRFDELFTLARDKAFQQEQKRAFLEDPDLPLTTVELALLSAAKMDDARAMAEFVLMYMWRKAAITQASPLDTLEGSNAQPAFSPPHPLNKVEQAGALADLYKIELSVLWHLLLIWELKDAGRTDEMRMALRRLLAKDKVRLSSWEGNFAAFLLSRLFDKEDSSIIMQCRTLLGDGAQRSLCQQLSRYGDFTLVSQLAHEIEDAEWQAVTLGEHAVEQAKVEPWENMHNLFTDALQATNKIEDIRGQVRAQATIAAFQAGLGQRHLAQDTLSKTLLILEKIQEIDQKASTYALLSGGYLQIQEPILARNNIVIALRMARKIDDPEAQFSLMKDIISELRNGEGNGWLHPIGYLVPRTAQEFERGSRDVALEMITEIRAKMGHFVDALRSARKIRLLPDRVQAMVAIAEAWRQSGETEKASTILAEALHDALEIKDEFERDNALELITKVQAAARTFEDALKTTESIGSEWKLSDALQIIVEAYIQVDDLNAAIRIAEKIERSEAHAHALIAIGMKQVKNGTVQVARKIFAQALQVAQKGDWQWRQSQALGEIAERQANTGDFEGAFQTARRIARKPQRAHALKAIAQAQANVKDYKAAMQTSQEIDPEFKGLVSEVLKTIVSNQVEAEELETAFETVQTIDDVWQRSYAMENIALAWASRGEYGTALKKARKIESLNTRATTLVAIAVMQIKSGAKQDAQSAFAEALDVCHNIEDIFSKENALRIVASTYAAIGDFDTAFQIGWAIKAVAVRQKALIEIAMQQVRATQVEAVTQTSIELFKKGYLPVHESLYNMYPDPFPIDILVFTGITALLEQDSRNEDSHTTSSVLEKLKKPMYSAEVLKSIALFYAASGAEKIAKENFSIALQAAKIIEDMRLREETICAIAKAQIRAGLGKEAIKTATLLLSGRNDYLPEIAVELLKANDLESFKQLLVPCANYPEAAYQICGLLAQVYPEKSKAIAELVYESSE